MGIFSRFESKMEDGVESAAAAMSKGPISPVQIAKKAEKQMKRGVMVGAGKEYAPTLYTVLVNPDDDARMTGYYPTLAGETETYLEARAAQEGLVMDGHPLVRFIVDDTLRHGKFDIIAETVAAPIVSQLRDEEMERYGINIISVSIENIDFTDAFTDAVEAKQVAQQSKLKAEIEQDQATMEAQQAASRKKIAAEAEANVKKINADAAAYSIRAEAEAKAEANKQIAESLTDGLIKYTEISQWNGQLPTYMAGEGSQTVPVLNLEKGE